MMRRATLAWLLTMTALLVLSGASAMQWTDVATEAGIDFARIGDPENPSPNFLEIMGGGGCWLDHDNDGWQDLYLVDSWLRNESAAQEAQPKSRLYANQGDGTFDDVTDGTGVGLQGWYMGCAAADLDANGWDDLIVVGYGLRTILWNNGDRTFTEGDGIFAADKTGEEDLCGELPCWGTGAAVADYNRDGCPDLYIYSFAEYDLTDSTEDPVIDGRLAQANQLYENHCDRSFTDVTATSGASGDPGPRKGRDWAAAWLDYDQDGYMDIYTASDGVPNTLLRNEGDGTFTERGPESGTDDGLNGMGLAVADCNRDGYEDLFFTHYMGAPGPYEQSGYDGHYVNLQNGTFEKRNGEGDLDAAVPYVGWGTIFHDFDLDGFVDIHEVTGHTETFADDRDQRMLLWKGHGDCTWTDIRDDAGPAFDGNQSSRGSTYDDFDRDGDMDVVVINIHNQPTQLFENTGVSGHWLTMELAQPGNNPRGLQAEVIAILPDGTELHRRLNPFQSIHSSQSPMVHFGLGDIDQVDLRIEWPDGGIHELYGVAADRALRFDRATAALVEDIFAPVITDIAPSIPPNGRGWITGEPYVTIEAEDQTMGPATGVTDSEAWTQDGSLGPHTALGEGIHHVQATAMDGAGNQAAPVQRTLRIDLTPPSMDATITGPSHDGWWIQPTEASATCTDVTSGVDAIEWSLSGSAWAPSDGVEELPVGDHTVQWRCTDGAGHTSVSPATAVRVAAATFPCTTQLAGPMHGDWYTGPVGVAMHCDPSPFHDHEVVWRYQDELDETVVPGSIEVSAEGIHRLELRATDAAGRTNPWTLVQVPIDLAPPIVELLITGPSQPLDDGTRLGADHDLDVRSEDAASGIASSALFVDGIQVQVPHTVEDAGWHQVTTTAVDHAGRTAETSKRILVDRSGPAIVGLTPAEGTINLGSLSMPVEPWLLDARMLVMGDVPFEAMIADDPAGIASVKVYVSGDLVETLTAPPWAWTWDGALADHPYPTVRIVTEDGVANDASLSFRVWNGGSWPWDPALS